MQIIQCVIWYFIIQDIAQKKKMYAWGLGGQNEIIKFRRCGKSRYTFNQIPHTQIQIIYTKRRRMDYIIYRMFENKA